MKKLRILFLALCLFIPLMMAGCKDEDLPALTTPKNVSVENGVIVFDAVEDAQYYTINIGSVTFDVYPDSNENVVVDENVIKYDANKILTVKNSYLIRVKACSTDRESSGFCTMINYKHVLKLDSPENIKVNGTVLTWDNVDNASQYVIKVVTPTNYFLYDEAGNFLLDTSSESISKAQLSEFNVTSNTFDFSKILSEGGNYDFYIKAEYSDKNSYTDSDFVFADNYEHFVKLDTPQNVRIDKQGDELFLTTVVDENANEIRVECGQYSKLASLKEEQTGVTVSDNLVDINLNEFFKDVKVEGFELDLSKVGLFEFSTTVYSSGENDSKYFLDSNKSQAITYVNKAVLPSPIGLDISSNDINSTYIASWNYNSSMADKVSGYKLLVATSSQVVEYNVNSSINSCQIGSDVVAVAVQAQGITNYVNSEFSDFVENPDYGQQLDALNLANEENSFSWNDVADYYIVLTGNSYETTESNEIVANLESVESKDCTVKVVAIKDGYKFSEDELMLSNKQKLETPTYTENPLRGYTISVNPVSNAIGYYVYLKGVDALEYVKIDKIFTTTEINLLPHMITDGKYSKYQVQVQAVASLHGKYENSDMSTDLWVNNLEKLESPKNLSILRINENDGTHFYLRFNGVENAIRYEVLINNNLIKVELKSDNLSGAYQVDITDYLTSVNTYNIKVRAISNSGNLKSSDYATYSYYFREQLQQVQNITISNHKGVYTLNFDAVENATEYKVRIEKRDDATYSSYLQEIGLTNTFVVQGAEFITDYLAKSGEYYVYITAMAPENPCYVDSGESVSYGVVNVA